MTDFNPGEFRASIGCKTATPKQVPEPWTLRLKHCCSNQLSFLGFEDRTDPFSVPLKLNLRLVLHVCTNVQDSDSTQMTVPGI